MIHNFLELKSPNKVREFVIKFKCERETEYYKLIWIILCVIQFVSWSAYNFFIKFECDAGMFVK